MLLVINGVEDSELALDLGHVFLTHSCGSMCVDWGYMGSVWMEGHRYKGRVDAPHQGRTWVLAPPPPFSPLALHQRPGVLPSMYPTRFPDSTPTRKSEVEEGGVELWRPLVT